MADSTQRQDSGATDHLWADAFARVIRMRERAPSGDGWLTRDGFTARAKVGKCKAVKFIAQELKAGRMEIFKGTQIGKLGRPTKQWWYRPVPHRPK